MTNILFLLVFLTSDTIASTHFLWAKYFSYLADTSYQICDRLIESPTDIWKLVFYHCACNVIQQVKKTMGNEILQD